jgi:hypothetical protein
VGNIKRIYVNLSPVKFEEKQKVLQSEMVA